MAGTVDIEIQGSEEIVAKLQNMANLEKLTPAVNKALAKVERTAKLLVPRVSGGLAQSIHTRPARAEGREVSGWVYAAKEYAIYVEYGTGIYSKHKSKSTWTDGSYHRIPVGDGEFRTVRGTKPNPFMYPALKNNTDYTKKVISNAVRALAKGES